MKNEGRNNNKVYQTWEEKGVWHPFSFHLFLLDLEMSRIKVKVRSNVSLT